MNTINNPIVTNQLTLTIEGKTYFLTQEEAESLYNQLHLVLNKKNSYTPMYPMYPMYPTYPIDPYRLMTTISTTKATLSTTN